MHNRYLKLQIPTDITTDNLPIYHYTLPINITDALPIYITDTLPIYTTDTLPIYITAPYRYTAQI